jgi:hypothetical protein
MDGEMSYILGDGCEVEFHGIYGGYKNPMEIKRKQGRKSAQKILVT